MRDEVEVQDNNSEAAATQLDASTSLLDDVYQKADTNSCQSQSSDNKSQSNESMSGLPQIQITGGTEAANPPPRKIQDSISDLMKNKDIGNPDNYRIPEDAIKNGAALNGDPISEQLKKKASELGEEIKIPPGAISGKLEAEGKDWKKDLGLDPVLFKGNESNAQAGDARIARVDPLPPNEIKGREAADQIYDLLKDGDLSKEDKEKLAELLKDAYENNYLDELSGALNRKLEKTGFGVSININADFANKLGHVLVTVKGLGAQDINEAVKVDPAARARRMFIDPGRILGR